MKYWEAVDLPNRSVEFRAQGFAETDISRSRAYTDSLSTYPLTQRNIFCKLNSLRCIIGPIFPD